MFLRFKFILFSFIYGLKFLKQKFNIKKKIHVSFSCSYVDILDQIIELNKSVFKYTLYNNNTKTKGCNIWLL